MNKFITSMEKIVVNEKILQRRHGVLLCVVIDVLACVVFAVPFGVGLTLVLRALGVAI